MNLSREFSPILRAGACRARWSSPRLLAVLFCAALALAAPSSIEAADGTASVRGRVLNVLSGQYLKNAQVSVAGTPQAILTNEYGEFQINNIAAGEVELRVTYPDLTTQVVKVTARAGETVQQDVQLSPAASRGEDQTVKLSPFIVAARRETEGRTIALNERRFAGDIRNVVAADEFGDCTEGNIGEFLKYIPGVLIDYNAAAARTVSIRGLPATTVPVSIDGNPVANASSSSTNRTFEFEQVSINNVSRVEVTKSATPDRPADSLGGSVNMISKSAFERATALLNYRAFLSVNDTAKSFGKSPFGASGERDRFIRPGIDFTYVKPVTKNFGFVVTGLISNQYNPQTLSQENWYPVGGSLPSGSPSTVTADTPYLGTYRFQTSPSITTRRSVGLTLDWRFTPRDTISFAGQYNDFNSYFYIMNYTFDTTLVSTFGPTYTYGSASSGNFYTATNWRRKVGSMWQPSFTYRHNGSKWTAEVGGYYSKSKNRYRDIDDGFFNYLTAGVNSVTVNFLDITPERPGTIQLVKSGTVLNPFDVSGMLITTTYTSRNFTGYQGQCVSNQSQSSDMKRGAHADFKRDVNLFIPVTLKFGVDHRENIRDIRSGVRVWRYNGADGTYGSGDEYATPFLNTTYYEAPYGFSNVQWLDARKMYQHFVANPSQFSEVLTGTYGSIIQTTSGSKYIEEAVSSGYLRTDTHFFKNRLWLVAGVRFERTKDKGEGMLRDANAIYVRDADGNLVLTNGKTTLLTSDSAEQLRLQYKDRGAKVSRTYHGYYPSVNASFKVTDKMTARASWARTMGRPDFGNIIPSTVVPDLSGTSKIITVNNTGLKPWQADNYDLSLEYYLPKSGVVSAGVFRKDFTNFFGTVTQAATTAMLESYSLDPDLFAGYSITTKANVGSARVTGVELDYNQPLTFLPSYARGISIFANVTSLHLQGPTTSDFNAFVPRNANWGISLNRPRFSVMLKWVYRSDQRLTLRTTTGAPSGDYQWVEGSLKLDLNAEYRLRKDLSFFVNARNITNVPYVMEYHAETTPAYARANSTQGYGVQWAVGIKGTF